MKIYLASRYSRREELCGYRKELEALGHKITSRWLNGGHQIADMRKQDPLAEAAMEDREVFATEDWDDLVEADWFISFSEEPRKPSTNRGGRHVEFGGAIAYAKRIVLIGPRENVFHCLPEVEVFPDWATAIESQAFAVPLYNLRLVQGCTEY